MKRMKRATAFCPAHITGFFSIHDGHEWAHERGSRGAGLNLAQGAKAVVEVRGDTGKDTELEIVMNGARVEAPITCHAMFRVVRDAEVRKSLSIKATVDEELPQSQGFGMSAAGSMAASLALCGALGMEEDESIDLAAEASHEAEIVHGGGLGDVAGQLAGGFEMRLKEGIPPYGLVKNLDTPQYFRRFKSDPGEKKVFVIWLKGGIPTSGILRDPEMRQSISGIGHMCLEELKEIPTLGNFMKLSYRFANGTGLMSPRMRGLCDALNDAGGMASMCMLGNSLFALDLEEGDLQIAGILSKARRGLPVAGARWTTVSERGPHFL